MRRTLIGATLVVALVGACGSGGGTAESRRRESRREHRRQPGREHGTQPGREHGGQPLESAAAGGDASAWAQTISGDAVLSGWQASPEEGKALQDALGAFATPTPTSRSTTRRSRATTGR